MFDKKIYNFLKPITNLEQVNSFLLKTRFKNYLICIGVILIIGWQLTFLFQRNYITDEFKRYDATGFNHNIGKEFFYFYYYEGLFPIVTNYQPLVYSKLGADNILNNHGDSLLMEKNHWYRYGEHCRILCYLPQAFITGSAQSPSLLPFNVIVFIMSLIFLYLAFWRNNQPLIGMFSVLLFGSSPFLLFETYKNENIFGLMIAVLLISLALNLRFFTKPIHKWYQIAFPIITAVVIATASNMRAEIKIVLVCVIFIYLTAPKTNLNIRIIFSIILVLAFLLTNACWRFYFDKKFEKTYEVVCAKGGNPFNGLKVKTHPFWHPVYCGLGDFDTHFGYNWDDETKTYRYAVPKLREIYNINVSMPDTYSLSLNEFYDKKKRYYRKLEEIPEYEKVVRQKVMMDIKNNPLWYAEIIAKRIRYVFTINSPIALSLGRHFIIIPFSGLLLLPFILILWKKKQWFYLKLLIFSLPLATTSIIIYAKKNTTFNSCFHLFLAALVLSWIIEGIVLFYQYKVKNRFHG